MKCKICGNEINEYMSYFVEPIYSKDDNGWIKRYCCMTCFQNNLAEQLVIELRKKFKKRWVIN